MRTPLGKVILAQATNTDSYVSKLSMLQRSSVPEYWKQVPPSFLSSDVRLAEATKVRERHPDRVPVSHSSIRSGETSVSLCTICIPYVALSSVFSIITRSPNMTACVNIDLIPKIYIFNCQGAITMIVVFSNSSLQKT